MTQAEKEFWELERAKGYDRFLLRKGLLGRGLPFAVLVLCFKRIFTESAGSISRIVIEFAFNAVALTETRESAEAGGVRRVVNAFKVGKRLRADFEQRRGTGVLVQIGEVDQWRQSRDFSGCGDGECA